MLTERENAPESTDTWSRNPDNPPEEDDFEELNDDSNDEEEDGAS